MIVVQVFTNLDEFIRYAEQTGRSLTLVLANHFAPYVVLMFERLSGLLALLAILFVIAWLNKTNEFTALLAAGVTKKRAVKPLLFASAVVVLGAVATREFVIPTYQDHLDRTPQDLTGDLYRQARPQYDERASVLIQGKHLLPTRAEIVEPQISVMGDTLYDAVGSQVLAETAHYRKADGARPSGYHLKSIQRPTSIDDTPSVHDEDGKPILLTSFDTDWIGKGECFLASDVEIEMLNSGSSWKQYASTAELIKYVGREDSYGSNAVRVQIHQRVMRPFVDWTVLLLGIPVLLSRPDRHMFWVAGACMGITAGFTVIVLGVAAMGSSGKLLSPTLAIWLPLLVFLPWGWAKTKRALET